MKKKALTDVISDLVETQRFKDDFRYYRIYDGSADQGNSAISITIPSDCRNITQLLIIRDS